MGYVPPPPPKWVRSTNPERDREDPLVYLAMNPMEDDMTAQQKGGARFDVLNSFLLKMGGMKGTTKEMELLVGIMHATAKEAIARGYTLNLSADGEVRAVLGVAGVVDVGDTRPMIITSKSVMGKITIDDILGVGRRKVTPKK